MQTHSSNYRFEGAVIVMIQDRSFIVDASSFSLAEAGPHNLGDGDIQHEELWVAPAPIDEETGEPAGFDEIHVCLTKFNDGQFEFHRGPEVRGAGTPVVKIEDDLEISYPACDEDELY